MKMHLRYYLTDDQGTEELDIETCYVPRVGEGVYLNGRFYTISSIIYVPIGLGQVGVYAKHTPIPSEDSET